MPHSVLAQSKTKKYVGSSQFFDIAGDWVNNGDTATRRITRMNVSATIVNTYRIYPHPPHPFRYRRWNCAIRA